MAGMRKAPGGPKNTSTKKSFNNIEPSAVGKTHQPRFADVPNKGPVNDGQAFEHEAFANPMQAVSAEIGHIAKTYDDIGEKSGFITDGYLDKGGTPYGEAAKFNFLPPGMDISNQENAEINMMPLRKITAESYPGDGWMPAPRDITE